MHRIKIAFFCRVCGEAYLAKLAQSMYKKSNLQDIISECYQYEFSKDIDSEHPDNVCKNCHNKLKSCKDKHTQKNLEQNIEFNPNISLPGDLLKGSLPCFSDGACKVCLLKVNDPDESV